MLNQIHTKPCSRNIKKTTKVPLIKSTHFNIGFDSAEYFQKLDEEIRKQRN